MAIELKYSLCEAPNCKSVSFKGTTGTYDAVNNIGGWGAPNEVVGDAISAVLVFTSPEGVVYPSVDVLALGFPRVGNCNMETILATDIDPNLTEFSDGFWSIEYTVTTGTTSYTQTQELFFYGQIKKQVCCLVSAIDITDCDCDLEKVNQALLAHAYLLALQYAVQTANTTSVTKIFALLENLIKCTTCK